MEDNTKSKRLLKFQKRHRCPVCNISTNSDSQFDQHLEGFRHRHKNIIMCNIQHRKPENYDYDSRFYVPAFILFFITTYFYCYIIVKLYA